LEEEKKKQQHQYHSRCAGRQAQQLADGRTDGRAGRHKSGPCGGSKQEEAQDLLHRKELRKSH